MILRNGLWILAFYVVLAICLVPATILLSEQGTTPGLPLQALMVVIATAVMLALRREHPRTLLGTAASWRRGVPIGLASALVAMEAICREGIQLKGDLLYGASAHGLRSC